MSSGLELYGFVWIGVVGGLGEALGGVYSVEVWHRLERCTRLLVLLSTCLRAESSSFAVLVFRFAVMRKTVMWRLRDLSPCLLWFCFMVLLEVSSGGETLFWITLSSPFPTEQVFWFLQLRIPIAEESEDYLH
ncbi:hypothetical protein F2Q70_00031769 [Brassica cretica]|uniref:Uncharacterized protein n=1 Tax=Brassica cretica TaxID=69181 RepID=A0A8S9FHH2_BRACR|nr:hypothetical protein F2Q70_00031769 [Brassica cretica]